MGVVAPGEKKIPLFRRSQVQTPATGPWNKIQITFLTLTCPTKCW